jgi:hypothetical protein
MHRPALSKMKSFPRNHTVRGRPANESMASSMAKARCGARWLSPAKSENSSPPAACAISRDKALAKHLLRDAGVATPDFLVLSEATFKELGAAAVYAGQSAFYNVRR